jgi:hypothetical protein
VWCEDEAGPYQTKPYMGSGWHPMGCPGQLPHEYQRAGTVKFMTLFHPATGMIRTKGASSCTNVVLHAWLKQELVEILQALPEPTTDLSTDDICAWWESWREGLTVKATLRADPPPLRLLLVMDNLRGHHTPDLLRWFTAHGILPLYTPLGGSWLNMCESIQRIIKRRALDGHHPTSIDELMAWWQETVVHWNAHPTAFAWGGKRQARRVRARARQHALGGSGACTHYPVRRRLSAYQQWRYSWQTTH